MIPLILLLSMSGWVINLAFAQSLVQPDWSLALLLGALLAHRGHWPWVMLAVWLHDLVLHWSAFVLLPWMLLAPLFMAWSDEQIGPGLMQRFMLLLGMMIPLWFWGWDIQACFLTMTLSMVTWYVVARHHEQHT